MPVVGMRQDRKPVVIPVAATRQEAGYDPSNGNDKAGQEAGHDTGAVTWKNRRLTMVSAGDRGRRQQDTTGVGDLGLLDSNV